MKAQNIGFFNPDDFADGFQKRMLRDFHLEYIQGSRGNTQIMKLLIPSLKLAGSKIQNPRPFREEATHIVYHENSILSIPESDGTLSDRCFEFKYFTSSLKCDNNFTKFVRETLRFSCGVLNARKNGTICFGVGDNVQHEDGEKFKHGQIIGFPITEENRDCKTNYTDALRQGISKCFNRESYSAALQCIKNPVFVTVLTEDKQMSKFVMEVDICSLSNFCQNLSFRVNLNKYGEHSKKYENDHLLFLRQGSATIKLSCEKEIIFLKIEFEQIVKSHKDEEQASLINKKACRETSAFYKLQELFCRRAWINLINLSFLKKIKSIFLILMRKAMRMEYHSILRNKDETELHDESIFKEYSGQFDTLKSHLRIPQEDKTIWIFSNGRSGILEPKLHLKQAEWRLKYKSGQM
ncbi:LOW QUALITY PROTEIN: hypothetical protein KUTeg_006096 [Tegillarca granosa]|uniref:Schlafen AlbA-2 domain-containing protein n=1 Tax=Tegillarca granosa TaxID=220873 RepID=A0ABQ9FHT3_TEGGR|nr:LOW QUALITY PROTEIN: hypothetical protein KUTeg_006096 [Tegillarca granosa]